MPRGSISPTSLARARAAIANARSLLITAGAGMGVDSGLPDFRGTDGFWRAYPPLAKLGMSFSDIADPEWFDADPSLAWGFYGHRLALYRSTIPHRGFHRLLETAQRMSGNYFTVTSNVDGHFQKAGFSPERVLEIHGTIHRIQCSRPCSPTVWPAPSVPIRVDPESMRAIPPFPCCPLCGRIMRPNILMFSDSQWVHSQTAMQQRAFQRWLTREAQAPLLVIECGAGTAIPSIRMLSEEVARRQEATLIRINPVDFNVPESGIALKEGALSGLGRLLSPP